MATARELLEQADALMRRNRQPEPQTEIPELTEAIENDEDGASAVGEDSIGDFGAMEDEAPALADEAFTLPSLGAGGSEESDAFPVLTEVVLHLEPAREGTLPGDEGTPARWSEVRLDRVVPADAVLGDVMPLPPVPPFVRGAAPLALVTEREQAREGEGDDARWDRLAEDVRMQVLQRIDIFTDTGLQEQLKERLQPIVDRASADLVATINQQVGQLLRAYVAEAIEREIDRWRQGGG